MSMSRLHATPRPMRCLMRAKCVVPASMRPQHALARQTPFATRAMRIAATVSLRLQSAPRLQTQPAQPAQETARCAALAASVRNAVMAFSWQMITLANRLVHCVSSRQQTGIATIATMPQVHAPALPLRTPRLAPANMLTRAVLT